MIEEKVKGEMKLPANSVVKFNPNDGTISVEEKKEREKKSTKLDDEALDIWQKGAQDDSANNKAVYIYKKHETAINGVDKEKFLVEPLSTFKNTDIECWLADRAEGGFTYHCLVKTTAGRQLMDFPLRIFYFSNDGIKFGEIDEKLDRGFNRKLGVGNDFGLFPRNGRRSVEGASVNDVSGAIQSAVKLGMEAAKEKDNGNDKTVELIDKLTSVVVEQKKIDSQDKASEANSVAGIITALSGVLAPIITQPKQDNTNQIMEVVREISRESASAIKELGKMITETNQRMMEMQMKVSEERSRDKLDMMEKQRELIEKISQNKGSDESIIKSVQTTNAIQAMAMTSAMEIMQKSMKVYQEVAEMKNGNNNVEETTMLERIVEKAPEIIEAGTRAFQSMSMKMPAPVARTAIQKRENVTDRLQVEEEEGGDEELNNKFRAEVNKIVGALIEKIQQSKNDEQIADELLQAFDLGILKQIVSEKEKMSGYLDKKYFSPLMKYSRIIEKVVGKLEERLPV